MLTQKLKAFWSACRTWLEKQAKKETTLFENSKHPISFKPFLAYQGLAVLLIFFAVALFFIPQLKINQSLVVKSAVIKQNTTIIAGGNPVKWTALIKKSDVNSSQYLLILPKNAKNIKISSITANQAKAILASNPKEQLSLSQRQQIAKVNQPKSFFMASLFDSISNIGKFFLSSIKDGADMIAEQIAQPEIQTVEDAKVVDLEKAVEKLEKKEAKEESVQISSDSAESELVSSAPSSDGAVSAETESSATSDIAPVASSEQSVIASEATQSDNGIASSLSAPRNDESSSSISSSSQSSSSSSVLSSSSSSSEAIVEEILPQEEYVQVDYETPAPTITEESTDTGKLVTVSVVGEDPAHPLTDVLASTKIPEIYKVGQEGKIRIKWQNNDNKDVSFHAYDTNGNGKLDYIEWTVPHMSDQIFQIIFISKAFLLDSDYNILEDIYDAVKTKDNVWAPVASGQYVRYTFQQPLTSANDNTIYARPSVIASSGEAISIEVWPVYADADGNYTEGPKIATFPEIDKEDTYKIMLTNMQAPTAVFDMKISGGSVEIDYIVDPTPSGVPADELTEPANANSIGNLQTIIGTPNSTATGTATIFNYLRLLEKDRLNTVAGAVAESATDEGKLEDLLGSSATAQDRATIFDYIHLLYNSFVNLIAGNIKSGATIGGLTGTYTGNYATGQVATYSTAFDDGGYRTGTAMSYTDIGAGSTSNGVITDSLSGLMWVKEPQKIIPGAGLAGITTNQIQVAHGDWTTGHPYNLGDLVRDAGGVNASAQAITSITAANPGVITLTNAPTVTSGQIVLIGGFDGDMGTLLNGNIYYVLVSVTAKTLTLYSNNELSTKVDTTGKTYTVAGTATQTKFYVCSTAHTSGTFTTDVAGGNWRETVWTASAANLTTPSTMAWLPTGGTADAVNNCENLTYAGYSDWRLPNVKELFNILVEAAGAVAGVKSAGAPYINQTVFPNTVSSYYWSSTTTPGSTTSALGVGFNNGSANYSSKTSAYYIRCVRAN